jgi:hypothetical protein
MSRLRGDYRKNILVSDRVAALEDLPGWEWDPSEADFQQRLGAVEQFVAREGHALVPAKHREPFGGEDSVLGKWVSNIRIQYRRGELLPEQVAALEVFPGWSWDPLGDEYRRTFAALEQFVAREGHARVPADHMESLDGHDIDLGGWASKMRSQFRKGDLSVAEASSFEAFPGWEWDPREADYQRRLVVLEQFVLREGHARVPQAHVEVLEDEEFRLGSWASARRTEYHKGRLSTERAAALEALPGWVWGLKEANYRCHVGALHQFANREGHTQPTRKHVEVFEDESLNLGSWLYVRRREYRDGELAKKRIVELEQVPGWTWSTR